MGNLGHNDNNHVFELSSENREPLELKEDVLNWDNDDKAFERDSEGGGTLRKINTKVEIVGEGVNYIDGLINVYGYSVKAAITKRAKSKTKIGEDWESQTYNLDLMLGEFNESNGKRLFSVPFTQGGLYDRVRSRISNTYDLVNTKSADNKDITELSTITEQVTGREIYRKTELEVDDYVAQEVTFTGSGEDTVRAVPFQLKNDATSDPGHIDGTSEGSDKVYYSSDTYQEGSVGTLLYFDADQNKTLTLNGKILVRILDTNAGYLEIEEVRYKKVADVLVYVDGSRTQLGLVDTGGTLNEGEVIFDDYPISLQEGESVAIVCHVHNSGGGSPTVKWEYQDTALTIESSSIFPSSEAKTLLPHEIFDRLLEKITGEKGLFKSNLFGRQDIGYNEDGEWSLLGVGSGFWARGFDLGTQRKDANGELIPFKQFNTSLKDAYESYYMALPLMWSIEEVNGKEYFRLEKYEYTQQDFVGVKLGRTVNNQFQYISASNAKRTFLTDNFYTKVEIGYEKGGSGYEEVFGLTAPHGKAEYNTSLKDQPANTYSKVSKIRADLEAYELARIKPSRLFQDEDTPYDQDLFFRHLKKVGTAYYLRTWQDDFSELPSGGIFSPETTGNLLLTPFNCLKRHSRLIATSVYGEPYGHLTFASSNCYTSLILDGVSENSSVLNKDLGEPFINGQLMTFDGFVYPETVEQLEGKTFVNGEYIPNWYGLFEFELNNRLVRGKLIKSTINGNSKHEIALV
ncbi:hypothetical protein DHD32_01165 [Arenibacter sp. TNZ]|uniref:hypothetical protein n=1 Tax=Arenibacter TaxID=178469 RepID=UPI000CD3F880|nr:MULTISPECIES: hypothetical protein [Arenibacter]MCM4170073.1 hypothetical protein [Arenibacter sp. TNZ]